MGGMGLFFRCRCRSLEPAGGGERLSLMIVFLVPRYQNTCTREFR